MAKNIILIILVLLTQAIIPQSAGASSPQPNIILRPTSIDFGNVPVSGNSSIRTVTVANNGTADLEICDIVFIGTDAPHFAVLSVNTTCNIIPPGVEVTGTVRFNPLSAGRKSVKLCICSNDPDEIDVYCNMSGTGVLPQPDINVNPTSVNFGSVQAGYPSATQKVTVSNTGSANLTIGTLTINDSRFTISAGDISGQKLAPGASANISLVFTPTVVGASSANLTIPSNDPDENPVKVALSGVGTSVLQPDINVNPTSVNFGSVQAGYPSATQKVAVSNTGSANLTIGTLTINDSRFTISAGDISGQKLAPGASANISLVFTPTVVGASSANLTIPSNDPDENPVKVALSGVGTAPELKPDINVDPTSVNFGMIQVGSSSATQNVTVSNAGTANLTIGNIIINNGQFEIFSGNISGQKIVPGASANISIIFVPTVSGAFIASLNIPSNDIDVVVTLSGVSTNLNQSIIYGTVFNDLNGNGSLDTGEQGIAGVTVSLDGATNNVTDSLGQYSFTTAIPDTHTLIETDPTGYYSTTNNTVSVNVVLGNSYQVNFGDKLKAPDISVNPTSVDFGSVKINFPSVTVNVTVSNTGTANLTIGTLNINDSHFTISAGDISGQKMAPGTSANISLVFTPTAVGASSANLTIPSDDENVKVALTGTGASNLQSTISGTVFEDLNSNGTRDSGEPGIPGVHMSMEIWGGGTADNITDSSGNYSFLTNVAGLHRITETNPTGYQSTSPDTVQFDVIIGTNYPDINFGDKLKAPDINVNPTSVDFGSVKVNFPSATVNVTVSNTGTANLTIGTLNINDSHFTISAGDISGQKMAPGTSANISLVFTPTAIGAVSANLTIPSDDENVKVALSGTGMTDLNKPKIQVSPIIVSWGSVTANATVPNKIVTVTNIGSDNLTIGNIFWVSNPAPFYIASDNASGKTMAPGVSANVSIGLNTNWNGLASSMLEIPSNDPDRGVGVGVLVGAMVNPNNIKPVISVIPLILDFGDVPATYQPYSSSPCEKVTITNTGSANLTVEKIEINHTMFHFNTTIDMYGNKITMDESGGELAPGESKDVVINFTPYVVGPQSANLTIYSNAGNVDVLLKGNGIPKPRIQVSPRDLSFGVVPSGLSSSSLIATVTNTGNADLEIHSVYLSNYNKDQFSIVSDNASLVHILAPGVSANISIKFNPTSEGNKYNYITIESNSWYSGYDPNPPTVYLSGVASPAPKPQINVYPAWEQFGNVATGSSSDIRTETVYNSGSAILHIGALSLQGQNPNQFRILEDNVSNQDIAPGASGTFKVQFVPTTDGAKEARVEVPSNDPYSPVKCAFLGGNGEYPPVPIISVTPLEIDFGSVKVDSSSAEQTVNITNKGAVELVIGTVSLVGANSGDFEIVSDNGSLQTLAPNTSAIVAVRFSPHSTGNKEAGLQIPSNDPYRHYFAVVLKGKAIPKLQPDIEVKPSPVEFGKVKVGYTGLQEVTIKNTGGANLHLSSINIGGTNAGDFKFKNAVTTPLMLTPNSQLKIVLRFQPKGYGVREAWLQFISDDPDGGDLHVALKGTGTGDPNISLSPTRIDFGSVVIGSSSAPRKVTIKNTGTEDLVLYKVYIKGGDSAHFSILTSVPSGTVVHPGASLDVSVKFNPHRIGKCSTSLIVRSNSYYSYETGMSLSGTGVAGPVPGAEISPLKINFGQVVVNTVSLPRTVRVTNTGGADLKVNTLGLEGIDPGQFEIVDNHVTGQAITPGNSATFGVRFKPTTEGAKQARVKLTTNDTRAVTWRIPLSGNGGEVPVPIISVEPTDIDFGEINISSNSTQRYVSITNNGTDDLLLDQITIDGGDAANFEIISDNASLKTLAPGDFAVVALQFKPITSGPKVADLSIPSSDPDNREVFVGLIGTGTGPNISVYPDALDFDYVQKNTASLPQTVWIHNDGTENLTISSITLTGTNISQFEITSDNVSSKTLAPWDWGVVTVTFKPTTIGTMTAILRISSNDADEPQFDVDITGIGTEGPAFPNINVTPTSIDFGPVDVYTWSVTQNVTVSNTGTNNLFIDDITINSDKFFIISGNISGQKLAPGLSANISLIFIPTAAGVQSANMTIQSDDPDESSIGVALTGTGIIHGTDLMITQTDSADPVNIGDNLTYTITVTNNGPDNATGVYVNDDLPAGFTLAFMTAPSPIDYISANASTGSITHYTDFLYWDIGNLASGANATLEVLVRLKPAIFATASSMNSTAEVYGNEYDWDLSNNKAVEFTTVRSTDLELIKTVSPATVNEGELFTWTVNVTNNGPEYATNVTVIDMYYYQIIDTHAIIPSAGTVGNTAPDWIKSLGITSSFGSSAMFWEIGDLAAGASANLTITASANFTLMQEFLDIYSLIGSGQPMFPLPNMAIVLSPLAEQDITNNIGMISTNLTIPLPQADLAITKTDSPDPATPGGMITYKVNVSNNGPEDVSKVFVLDIWDNNQLTLDATTPSTGTANQSMPQWLGSILHPLVDNKGYLFWDIGPLASGASVNLTMAATVNATLPLSDNLSNMAVVFGPAVDKDKDNNIVTENTTLTAITDLKITKTASLSEVITGDTLVYTIKATNLSSSNATDIRVEDILSDILNYVSSNASAGSTAYLPDTDNLTWEIDNLAGGATATLEVSVKVGLILGLSGNITNTATITGNVTDPDLANNSATAVTAIRATDLQISKTVSADNITYGEEITWTITVTNNGPETAENVTAIDVYYPQVTDIRNITPSTGSIGDTPPAWLKPYISSGPYMYWDVGNLAVGANATLTITATGNYTMALPMQYINMYSLFGSGAMPSFAIPNIAEVVCLLSDTNFGNNGAMVTTNCSLNMPIADLGVTKTASPEPVARGKQLVYTVNVTNNGPEDASHVYLLDILPLTQVTLDSTSPSTGTVNGTLPQWLRDALHSTAEQDKNYVFWDIGPLASSGKATLTVNTTVNATTPPGAPIFNVAVVFGPAVDGNKSNNTAMEITNIESADLAIIKTDSPDPVVAGGSLTYTVNITNNGPYSAQGVKVTDILSANITYQSATASIGNVTYSSGTVTWDVGTLAASDNATLAIIVTAPSDLGVICNNASVTADTEDQDSTNNSISENTTVVPAGSADLSIIKTDNPDPVATGDNLTYTLSVTNNGPADASGVVVSDTLSANVTYQSYAATAGTANYSSGTVTWNIGSLASGATANLTINVNAPADTGVITNIAAVNADTLDPNLANNTVSVKTNVVQSSSADLSIIKTDSPDPVATGDNLTYTLTITNNGPADASGVNVIDALPAGVSFQSATPQIGTVIYTSGIVTWNIGNLTAGASTSMVITVTAPAMPGTITNTATVTAVTTDPVPTNNTSTETTTVVYAPVYIDLQIQNTDMPDPVSASGNLTYTLTVTNSGPDNATGVVVTDTLSANVIYQSATPTTGTANHTSGNVTWNIGSLAAGASANLIITVTAPPSAGIIFNTANVSGNEIDLMPLNNSAVATTVVLPAGNAPDIEVTPTDIDFGAVQVNSYSSPRSVTVTNQGVLNLVIGALAINNSRFHISSGDISGRTMAPGESANITIIFNPIAAGAQSANLTIPSNDPDQGILNVTLRGTGTAIPDISVAPVSIDFGTVTIGYTSSIYTVTVNNTGNSVLNITGVTISNGQFTIYGNNISGQAIASGTSANISLIFTPTATGAQSAVLTIASDDPDENPVNVALSGTGTSSPGPGPGPEPTPTPTPPPTTVPPTTVPPTTPPTTTPPATGLYFTVDFLGKITREAATTDGRPINRLVASDPAGTHLLEVEAGTGASDNTNKTVTLIQIRETEAPPLPGNTRLVGKAYEFSPSGTVFDKAIKLTLGYNVDELPVGVTSVGAAYYTTGGGWVYLPPESASVAELGKLTSQVSHFTVFAVLATVAETPGSGWVVKNPASFKLNNLKITPSVSRIFDRVPFVIITGNEVSVAVDITNNGGEPGNYAAILKINGTDRETKWLTVEPGKTSTVTFKTTLDKRGSYLIQIGDLTGDFIRTLWINWLLSAGIIAGLILVCWFVIRLRNKRYG
jgi:uncharacterized repeat protein (TIGR01451 family)